MGVVLCCRPLGGLVSVCGCVVACVPLLALLPCVGPARGCIFGMWGYIGFCTPRHQLPGSASPAHASRRPNTPLGRPDTRQQRQQWHKRNKRPLQTEDAGATAQDMATRMVRTLQQPTKGGSRAPTTRHPGVRQRQRLHFAPLTHQQPRRTSTPNPSGYDHFYRGHRGQTVTTPLTHCHH